MLRARLGQQATQRISAGLTPAQQQSIKLLGLTNLELAELLAEAMAENPLLEPAADMPEEARARLQRPAPKIPPRPSAARPLPGSLARLFATRARSGTAGAGSAETPADMAASGPSLAEHLTGQLGVDLAEGGDRRIGQAMIEALDEAGYLTVDPAEIAERLRLDLAQVERV